MKTTHIGKNGVEYQIGHIISPDNESFDITVYIQFPTEEQYGSDDEPSVKLAGWHFGDYDPQVADTYIAE